MKWIVNVGSLVIVHVAFYGEAHPGRDIHRRRARAKFLSGFEADQIAAADKKQDATNKGFYRTNVARTGIAEHAVSMPLGLTTANGKILKV
jgi:hypothetical protein